MLRERSPVRPLRGEVKKPERWLGKQVYEGVLVLVGQLSQYFGKKEVETIAALVFEVLLREQDLSFWDFTRFSRVDKATHKRSKEFLFANPKHKEAIEFLNSTTRMIGQQWRALSYADRDISLPMLMISVTAFCGARELGCHFLLCVLSAILMFLALIFIPPLSQYVFLLSFPKNIDANTQAKISQEKNKLQMYCRRLGLFAEQSIRSENFFQAHDRQYFLPS